MRACHGYHFSEVEAAQAELEGLSLRLNTTFRQALRALVGEVAKSYLGRLNRSFEAEDELRNVVGATLLYSELLGRRRTEMEVPGDGRAQFAELPSLASLLGGTLQQALKHFGTRVSLSPSEQIELIDRYTFGEAFFVTRAATATIENRVRAEVVSFVEKGGDPEDTVGAIKQAGQFADAYARNVFRTNVVKAYNQGRVRQAVKSPSVWGYQFLATRDSNVRENHLAGHGFAAPKDHGVWLSHTPPLGYQCRCSVRPVTFAEAKVRGMITAEYPVPDAWHADQASFGGALHFRVPLSMCPVHEPQGVVPEVVSEQPAEPARVESEPAPVRTSRLLQLVTRLYQ